MSETETVAAGGLYNELKSWQQTNNGGQPLDTSGDFGNNPNNVLSIDNGYKFGATGSQEADPMPTGGGVCDAPYADAVAPLFNGSMTDPLVIDLSGNGVQLVPLAQSNAYFDLHDTGFAVHTGWVGPETGLLVEDNNGNGVVDNITELFGNSSTDGFAALAALDTNHDGTINAQDPGFSSLEVWTDTNGNGVTDPGELHTLASLGITSINLTTTAVNQSVGGNAIQEIATYTKSDGSTGEIAEAYFDNSQLDSQFEGSYQLNPEVLTLPNLRGYGTLPDLYVAMSLDPTLLQMVQTFASEGLADAASFASQTRAILYQWAGVENVAPGSRGSYMDAQELAVLEKFVGESFVSSFTDGPDPSNWHQGEVLQAAFNQLFNAVEIRLLMQGPLASLVPGVGFNYDTDSLVGNADLSQILNGLINATPAISSAAEQYWSSVGSMFSSICAALGQSSTAYDGVLQTAFGTLGLPFGADVALAGNALLGQSGMTQLVASSDGSHFFDGGPSVRYEQGFWGDDTFVFNAGYGQLEINETDYSGARDNVLKLGSGISESSVTVQLTSNGSGIVLTDGVSGDQITLDNMLSELFFWGGYPYGVQQVEFADGTVWTEGQLFAMARNIKGTTGNDTLQGTSGADLIDGKGGSDYEVGNGGNDTFIFNPGYGHLEINETDYSAARNNVLELGTGISPDQISVSFDNNQNIILTIGSNGDQIRLDGMGWEWGNGWYGVQQIQFADGTIWTAAQVIAMASNIQGTTGNDTLYGSGWADIFDGKGGNDVEIGNGGADTFIFDPGYGQLDIQEREYDSSIQAVLQLGAGIDESAVTVRAGNNGSDLVLTDGITGDQVTLSVALFDYTRGSTDVGEVKFADGTVWTAQELFQKETTGTPGNDTMYGSSAAEVFDGKGGNDIAYGGGGADTFIFNAGYGHLEVSDDSTEGSVLQLGAGISDSSLKVTTNASASDLILSDGITGDEITLDKMLADPSSGVQTVQFADGTTLSRQQLIAQIATEGTPGNDSLYGTAGVDYFDGRGGDDYEQGNGGNDIFYFGAGYGQLEILEKDPDPDAMSTLQFGDGISASAVTVSATPDGNGMVLTDGIAGDQVTIDDVDYDWYEGRYGVGQVRFADGTTWSHQQLYQMYIDSQETTGDDYLVGASDAQLFDGHGGNDYEEGDGGGDTFIYNAGYGSLEIYEYDTDPNNINILKLGAGIDPSSVAVKATEWGDLVLTEGISGDEVTLDSMTLDCGVQEVQFADGTIWTRQQVIQMELDGGTSGDDTLAGTSGADLLDGKGGNDLEAGQGGNDTFVFNPGYGSLEIQEFNADPSAVAVLQLGAGIVASSVKVSNTSGGATVLTDGVSGDQITLDAMAQSPECGVQQVDFADGTIWTAAELIQMADTGTSGNDTLYGTYGADLIDGHGGNDLEIGQGGNDTYVMQPGYGALTVDNGMEGIPSPNGQLLIDDAAPNQIWLQRSGNDLHVDIMGSTTEATIQNWFSNTYSQLGELTVSGGSAGNLKVDTQINQLIQAMATFSSNNPGFDPTASANPAITDPTVLAAVNSAWHQ